MARPMSIELVNEYGTHAVSVRVEGGSALLEAADVDAVIAHLSLLRASMHPEVPKTPSRTHRYVVEIDPCWHVEHNALLDGAVLLLRHTGLNWAGFAIPHASLVQLVEALSNRGRATDEAARAEYPAPLPN
jgi:hypothetical protein